MPHSKVLRCIVITPRAQALDAEATDVVLPAHDGLVGVLPGHAPFLCKLGTGLLRYRDRQKHEHAVFLETGFGHICNNELWILTPNAITQNDIEAAEADEQLHQAQTLPTSTVEEVQVRRQALRRAQYLQKLIRFPDRSG